jgi:sugar phosphate isomerase/epimerase
LSFDDNPIALEVYSQGGPENGPPSIKSKGGAHMEWGAFKINRRAFTLGSAALAASMTRPAAAFAKPAEKRRFKYCAFAKFLHSLSFDELADAIAAAGFDGVEVTARATESNIHPERAEEVLPKLTEALAKRGLNIMILTTDILSVDQPHAQKMLRAAAKLKIERYRLGFFRYDLKQDILPQLKALQPVFKDIAAMNREIGIAAVFQNHSGAEMVGATVWDLHSLIKDYPTKEIGCVFDIRHAAVEAGEAWPIYFNLMKPHLGAISVKDFRWEGRKSRHVPLGKGGVDPKFFKMLQNSDFSGPISVHVEYLTNGSAKENIAALKTDFATLREWTEA